EQLANEYKDSSRLRHTLVNEKDYISHPKDDDGYRGIHLNYRYKNIKNTHYDGLRIELQIRTKLQHIWATAVETVGIITSQSLKTREGEQRWIDFFALVSSAFAYKEDRPRVPRFAKYSYRDTARQVSELVEELRVRERIQAV